MQIVKQHPCFCDPDFEPRINLEHNKFITFSLTQRIQHWFSYFVFAWKTYLTSTGEERKLRQMVFRLANTESDWTKYYCQLYTTLTKVPTVEIRSQEHSFFEQTSHCCKFLQAADGKNLPVRLFPSELLEPIHWINAPQRPEKQSENIKKGKTKGNPDLYGLTEIGLPQFNKYYEGRDKVEHKSYIEATEQAASTLKAVTRSWRIFIFNSVNDYTFIQDFKQWKGKLNEHMEEIQQAWDVYIEAHEIHRAAYHLLCQADFFNNYYQARTCSQRNAAYQSSSSLLKKEWIKLYPDSEATKWYIAHP